MLGNESGGQSHAPRLTTARAGSVSVAGDHRGASPLIPDVVACHRERAGDATLRRSVLDFHPAPGAAAGRPANRAAPRPPVASGITGGQRARHAISVPVRPADPEELDGPTGLGAVGRDRGRSASIRAGAARVGAAAGTEGIGRSDGRGVPAKLRHAAARVLTRPGRTARPGVGDRIAVRVAP